MLITPGKEQFFNIWGRFPKTATGTLVLKTAKQETITLDSVRLSSTFAEVRIPAENTIVDNLPMKAELRANGVPLRGIRLESNAKDATPNTGDGSSPAVKMVAPAPPIVTGEANTPEGSYWGSGAYYAAYEFIADANGTLILPYFDADGGWGVDLDIWRGDISNVLDNSIEMSDHMGSRYSGAGDSLSSRTRYEVPLEEGVKYTAVITSWSAEEEWTVTGLEEFIGQVTAPDGPFSVALPGIKYVSLFAEDNSVKYIPESYGIRGAGIDGTNPSVGISRNAVAEGINSVAIGNNSSSSGTMSVSIGNNSNAKGDGAVAVSSRSNALSLATTAIGHNVVAHRPGETTIGGYAGVSSSILAIREQSAYSGGEFFLQFGPAFEINDSMEPYRNLILMWPESVVHVEVTLFVRKENQWRMTRKMTTSASSPGTGEVTLYGQSVSTVALDAPDWQEEANAIDTNFIAHPQGIQLAVNGNISGYSQPTFSGIVRIDQTHNNTFATVPWEGVE